MFVCGSVFTQPIPGDVQKIRDSQNQQRHRFQEAIFCDFRLDHPYDDQRAKTNFGPIRIFNRRKWKTTSTSYSSKLVGHRKKILLTPAFIFGVHQIKPLFQVPTWQEWGAAIYPPYNLNLFRMC